jgi:NADPH2:quinone reductase
VKAVVLHEVGGPLTLEEVPDPVGTAIEVRAAGVNFADVLIRRGLYPQMPPLPYVLGNEVCGELDGRRVLAFAHGAGGYAERVKVDPADVLPLPESASFAAGAAFLTTYLTAHLAMRHVTPGSTVLVHAGSGGVGSAAVQLAKRLGATVIATASTAEKRAFARRAGADEAIGYEEIGDLKVDVVVDPVGGEIFDRSLPLLNPLGTIVAVGYTGGLWNDPSVQWLVGRNVSVAGVFLGRLMRLRPDVVRADAQELLTVWERGEIDPIVGATFPLAEADAAHGLIESRRHVGKVVLEP